MAIGASKFGQWTQAGIVLQGMYRAAYGSMAYELRQQADLLLERMLEHLERQDLNWPALSPETIKRKVDNKDKILIETGELKSKLKVRKIATKTDRFTVFVGADAWERHRNGLKMSDLMIYLEYGTDNMPARPLMGPTWEEMKPGVKNACRGVVEELVSNKFDIKGAFIS